MGALPGFNGAIREGCKNTIIKSSPFLFGLLMIAVGVWRWWKNYRYLSARG